ncbi:YkgJ family cysteine cluster protein [Burkholderia sp. 22PA0106]|uniref:YkgJ family cysteine cluster protein n=1 Tax=Burkholderia sp. 22PA0106 TaxID=3237371 RepID=UPI0039C2F505
MSDIPFHCTSCGNCCHDLRLPVTPAEARTWLERGGRVDILCEAVPWLAEPEPDNAFGHYKRDRSFAAASGSLPIRVDMTLAASFSGPCPNLDDAMRCTAYEIRPMVCRVYPAEMNPFIPLVPANKGCPPEAWASTQPLIAGGVIVEASAREAAERSRVEQARAAPAKRAICEALGIGQASVSNEGFLILSPEPARLLDVLHALPADMIEPGEPNEATVDTPSSTDWTLVTNRQQTVDALAQVGASGALDRAQPPGAFLYFGMFDAS